MSERSISNLGESAVAGFWEPPRPPAPWLTVREAAGRARCGVKTIYREVRERRLKAARIGGRRELRLKPEWVDDWLMQATDPQACLTPRLR